MESKEERTYYTYVIYERGKDFAGEFVYVGSTINPTQRYHCHMLKVKGNSGPKLYRHLRKVGEENIVMKVLEVVVGSKRDAALSENWWYHFLGAGLNTEEPCSEILIGSKREYNRQKIREARERSPKTLRELNTAHKREWRKTNRDRECEAQKRYRDRHRERIDWSCGRHYTNATRWGHFGTIMHKKYVSSLPPR